MNLRVLLCFGILLVTANSALAQKIVPTVEWDQTYGGDSSETLISALPTEDGGWLLAGESSSSLSGNKESPGYGGNDFWLVRIDSNGMKEWDATFGGENNEDLAGARPTSDGGCLLVGMSRSSATGNKETEGFGRETSAPNGFERYDYWLVKVNAMGDKEWDASFGGTDFDYLTQLQPTEDGGWLLAGTSLSPSSGNKESPGFGEEDFWLVKVDAQGRREWDASCGGTGRDLPLLIQPTANDGWILV